MAAEDFFARWAKKKSDAAESAESMPAKNAGDALPVSDATSDAAPPETAVKSLPTMEDVAYLTHDSDYSGFMAQGVDESVKRSAMKKLFTDPHFNVMDGLDVYIEDFNKFEPMTPAFIAGLSHAKGLMDPLAQLKSPLMKLLEIPQEQAENAAELPALAQESVAPLTASEEMVADEQAENSDTEKQEKINTSKEPNASRVDDI